MGKYTDFLSQTPQERTKSAVTALSEMTSIPVTFPWYSPPPLLELWIASNSLWITYHSNCSINACLYGCHMCKKVGVSSTGTQTCAVCITTLTLTYKKRSEQRQKSFISLPCLRKDPPYSGLCSGTVQWPLAVYFYYWATRKSWLFHRNPMLGSLDFPGSEHLVPLNFFFLRAQP